MKSNKLFIFLILIVGLITRIIFINQYPPSLNWDEVSHGFNAYSILKTGKDEWGNFLPIIFRCFGDYKLPLYIYLTVPFVAIFGLNAFSIRLVSVLAGTFIPLFIYLILKALFNSKSKIPFLGALIFTFILFKYLFFNPKKIFIKYFVLWFRFIYLQQ